MRAAQIADIWHDVFGADADRRLVRIIATQTINLGLEQQILNAPDVIAEGLAPPAASFDAYAVTGYFAGALGGEGKAATVRDWIARSEQSARAASVDQPRPEAYFTAHRYDLANDLAARELADGAVTGDRADSVADLSDRVLPYQARVAADHDLRLMMYEGGTHVVGMGAAVDDPALTAFFTQLNYSAQMAGLYDRLMQSWATLTPEPFNAFVDVASPSKYGSWGALRHLGDDNPRWQVLAKGCVDC
jgi:hypothetical protein